MSRVVTIYEICLPSLHVYTFTFSSQKEIFTKQPSLLGVLVLLHQWLIFQDGSLIADPTAIANALALLPKEDVNKEEHMAAAEAMASE